jgi:hypothetical protein
MFVLCRYVRIVGAVLHSTDFHFLNYFSGREKNVVGAEARIRNNMPEITRLSRGPLGISMASS